MGKCAYRVQRFLSLDHQDGEAVVLMLGLQVAHVQACVQGLGRAVTPGAVSPEFGQLDVHTMQGENIFA